MNHPILKATNLYKSFYYPTKVPILQGINLTVAPGQAIAIVGRSGQGKSTLLQILGTLDNACSGTLEIAGQQVTPFNKSMIRNKHVAFIFQSFHLMEDYTALENVLLPAAIGRQPTHKNSQAHKHGLDLLNAVGLSDRAHFSSSLLSGGEKQRVAIARALCNNPDIILADEPTGNLDIQTASEIHEMLLRFTKKQGKSLIVVTHDPDLAALCDVQHHLENGKL